MHDNQYSNSQTSKFCLAARNSISNLMFAMQQTVGSKCDSERGKRRMEKGEKGK